jgi:putative redox protein
VTITVANGASFDLEYRKKLERAAMTCPVHQSLHPDIAVPVEFIYA